MRKFQAIHTGNDLLLSILRVLVVGVVIGTLAALVALTLVGLVANGSLWIAASKDRAPDWVAMLMTVGIPALGGLIVGRIVMNMSDRRPHSPADVILAVQSNLKLTTLKLKDGVLNFAGSIISLTSGASLGEYGPIVNMGATLAANLQKFARTESYVLIGCGVAAAISAAFHAPIAGIIFAHEVIIRHFSLRAFAPITIAASISYYISNSVFNTEYLFQFDFAPTLYLAEYGGYITVGILSGLLAVIFLRSILYARLLSGKFSVPRQYKPMIGGLMIGLIALQIPDILGIGDQLMRQTLSSPDSAINISVLLLAKIVAAALSLGFGFIGGVFSPSLLIGILFGTLFGLGVEQLFPYSNIAVYAICGMAAVTSAVIGAPLTTILIIFELTHSYDLTMAVMVSVVFANIVSYRLFGRSIFDFQLKVRGYDLSHGRDPLILDTLRISSISHSDYLSLEQNTTVDSAIEMLLKDRANEAYVLDHAQRYVGSIRLTDLVAFSRDQNPADPIGPLADTDSLRLSPDTSVWSAMQEIKGFVGEAVPIVDEQSRELQGIIHETDLIDAYMQTLRELRDEETANA